MALKGLKFVVSLLLFIILFFSYVHRQYCLLWSTRGSQTPTIRCVIESAFKDEKLSQEIEAKGDWKTKMFVENVLIFL